MTIPYGVYFVRTYVLDLMCFQENINPLNNHKTKYFLSCPRVQIGTSTRLLSLSPEKIFIARQALEYYMGASPYVAQPSAPSPEEMAEITLYFHSE